MGGAQQTATTQAGMLPHVLMISNHWDAKRKRSFAGVFVDRQIASLKQAGVRISTFDVGTSHSWFNIFGKWVELRRRVRQLNPHLIHGQYGTIVGFLAAFAGRPAVISFCGGDLLPGASVSTLRTYTGFLLSNLAALRARMLICKSEELRQALWWRRNRAVVIPNGVDLNLFSPGPQDQARKKLGWDIRRPVVIFNAGIDAKRKGLDMAQAAMKVVRSRVPDAELFVISDVEPDRMPLYYRAADALLSTSILEGSPNVVKEALACNLPVVSTPVGDVPERLAGVHPSAVVRGDANVIGEALAQILLKRERSNGQEHIACLGVEHVAERILKVYRSALGPGVVESGKGGIPKDSAAVVEEMSVVPINEDAMVRDVADLHLEAFSGYFNTLMGRRYIRAFIRWFVSADRGIALAAIDGDHEVIGYALGAPLGYDRMLIRQLFWTIAAAILMRPWLLFNVLFWNVVMARLRGLVSRRRSHDEGLELPEPMMCLVAIGVALSERRKGIGLRLVRAFEARAEELKMRSLLLTVHRDNTAARHFYENSGWQACTGPVGKGKTIQYYRLLHQKP